MNPLWLVSGVGSVLQLGRAAKNAVTSSGQTSSSTRFEKLLEQAVSDLLKSKDTNHDGALSLTELGGDRKLFTQCDKNGNGKLDANELRSWYMLQETASNGSSASTARTQ